MELVEWVKAVKIATIDIEKAIFVGILCWIFNYAYLPSI